MLAVVGTETEPVHVPSADEIRARVQRTDRDVAPLVESHHYHGRWADLVLRSALIAQGI